MKTPKAYLKSLINGISTTARMMHGRTLRVHEKSFLRSSGWFQSAQTRNAVDKDGNPIPWLTYPSLFFIEPRIYKSMSIFEYGSGNSTLWWCSKVKDVVSCEHDAHWHQIMKDKLPKNAMYLFHELENDAYPQSIMAIDKSFDIVVIDGRLRNRCVTYAVRKLKKDGVIIWDNSERERYAEGFELLKSRGFKRIDFYGMGPINIAAWNTSIFYRAKNCFGI